MLTCKSLFGLGYRGERLIEPSASSLVVESRSSVQSLWLVGEQQPSSPMIMALLAVSRETFKLPEHPVRLSVLPCLRKQAWRQFSTLGRVTIRQIGTIGSQALQVARRPTGAVHRLIVGRGCLSSIAAALKI